jgi:hypothetical protein
MQRVCHLLVTVLGFALPWVAGAAAGAPAHTGAAKAPAGWALFEREAAARRSWQADREWLTKLTGVRGS